MSPYSAILALWIIENHAPTTSKKVSLYINNQSVIQSLNTFNSNSGQHLIQALKSAIINNRSNLTVKWISSHSKVLGNEKADQLAKNTAKGRSSALTYLPHLFRNPLPRSTSATKQAYNLTLHKIWTDQWNCSPRKNKIVQLGKKFPFKKFMKTLSKLTRKYASTILQIRSGHFPLNKYLYRINKATTKSCPSCLVSRRNAATPETIHHFIFECPAYTLARNILKRKLGHSKFNLPDIMSNPKHIKELINFINKTECLKHNNPRAQP